MKTARTPRSVGCLAAATVLAMLIGHSAHAAAPGSRYGGEERYETAALISQATYPGLTKEEEEQGAEFGCSAVLVSGEAYPDALSGSYLAGYLGRCLLLTARDRLPEPTIAELDRLNTDTVTIVGGPAAVSTAVEQELRDRGIDVDRMFGEDRYETAFRVAATRDLGGPPAVFLVSGVDFPDALSAGAWAHNLTYPVLLTTPEALHPQAEEALRQAQPGHVYVVGGPAAVSDEVMRQATMACSEAEQQRPCRTAERIAGGTRFSTATAVADRFSRDNPIRHVNLARGDTFPDALAGAAHSGDEGGATLFTASRDELGAETEAWLREHADTIETVDVYGSDVVVSDEVWEQAKQAAD